MIDFKQNKQCLKWYGGLWKANEKNVPTEWEVYEKYQRIRMKDE